MRVCLPKRKREKKRKREAKKSVGTMSDFLFWFINYYFQQKAAAEEEK